MTLIVIQKKKKKNVIEGEAKAFYFKYYKNIKTFLHKLKVMWCNQNIIILLIKNNILKKNMEIVSESKGQPISLYSDNLIYLWQGRVSS